MSTASQLVAKWARSVNLTIAQREEMVRDIERIAPPPENLSFDFGANAGKQRSDILNALKSARSQGRTNVQLNEICFRYGARIHELRRAGHKIDKEHIGGGVFRYTLSPESW